MVPEASEYWFYHFEAYPWDTSCFYSELYNGDSSGPVTLLDQTSVTAWHNSATYVTYTGITADENFWILVNTEMSSNGWPSILGDASCTTDHSFFSDDFIDWQPFDMGDYFIRSHDYFTGSDLATQTWGAIKTLFSE